MADTEIGSRERRGRRRGHWNGLEQEELLENTKKNALES